MQRISAVFGRVFDVMMLAACLLLLFVDVQPYLASDYTLLAFIKGL